MAIYQTGSSDASRTNNSSRSARIYKDLNLIFSPHPNTKDITRKTDIEAVKQSVKNLVLTNHYERPFHPEIGSNVTDILFEPMTPLTAGLLTKQISEVINNFEPRARLVSVNANPRIDRNEYEVTINFYVVNIPGELVSFTTMLERLR
jgi:phage baseplate assembly protein W